MAVNNDGRVTSVRLPQSFLRWLDRYGTQIGVQIREDLATLMLLSNPMLTDLNDYFTVDEACFISEALATSEYLQFISEAPGASFMPLHEAVYFELGKGEERELHKRWNVDIETFQAKIDAIGMGALHAYQLYHMARMAAQHTGKEMKEFKEEIARIFQTKEPT